jgi:hypothetical protein
MNKKQNQRDDHIVAGQLGSLLRTPQGTCVSVLLPLRRVAKELRQNNVIIRKAFENVRSLLNDRDESDPDKQYIMSRLEGLASTFVNDGAVQSIGFFISREVAEMITFPFIVNEGIIVADSFETRDVLYLQQLAEPYFVLSLDKSQARLFHGRIDSLVEVGESFPIAFEDEFEYERATLGSSHGYALKGFEKDKREITGIRLTSWMHGVGHKVSEYPGPLILAASPRLANGFRRGYHDDARIMGNLRHAFDGKNLTTFGKKAWELISDLRKKHLDSTIVQLDELDRRQKVSGLRNVWEAARSGRGLLLLVERDFQRVAYRPEGLAQIRLQPPKGRYDRIDDAVDDAIEHVKRTHGKVVFTDPHQLQKFQGIVLTLRY